MREGLLRHYTKDIMKTTFKEKELAATILCVDRALQKNTNIADAHGKKLPETIVSLK